MIARDEVLMGRDKEYPLTPDLERNLDALLVALNKFRALWGKPMEVTSGYRPGKYNVAAHGAPNSAHLTCEACDFADPTGALAQYCVANTDVLASCGLWMESPAATKGWVHLQIRPAINRIFKPY